MVCPLNFQFLLFFPNKICKVLLSSLLISGFRSTELSCHIFGSLLSWDWCFVCSVVETILNLMEIIFQNFLKVISIQALKVSQHYFTIFLLFDLVSERCWDNFFPIWLSWNQNLKNLELVRVLCLEGSVDSY